MKLIVAAVIAAVALLTLDALAYNGKYRRDLQRMAGYIATAYHVR